MTKTKGRRKEQPDLKEDHGEESFEQLMEESFKPVRSFEIGDEIDAYVIGFDKENVFLDMGTRLDGVLKRSDLSEKENQKLAEGQGIKVFITGKSGGAWQCSTRLGGGDTSGEDSHRNASLMALEDAFNRNLPVEGKITEVTKGGFEVQVMGVKTFCPISQIDKHYCDNPDVHLNQTYTFEIIRFEEEGNNIVVSRKEYLQHEARKEAEAFWEELNEDDVYDGVITAIRDFGAFVDIGGIEGLLHISEIAYERIDDAGKVLQVGQTVKVAVKNIDRIRRKVSLSAKALLDDPWVAAVEKLSPGSEVKGKVVRLKTFGAFVEIFPGVDGLVHISKLGTDRRHQHPKEVLKVGDIIDVRVLEIDAAGRKISLTMEKEEGDYSKDLDRLKKEQENVVKSKPGHMSELVEQAIKKDDE